MFIDEAVRCRRRWPCWQRWASYLFPQSSMSVDHSEWMIGLAAPCAATTLVTCIYIYIYMHVSSLAGFGCTCIILKETMNATVWLSIWNQKWHSLSPLSPPNPTLRAGACLQAPVRGLLGRPGFSIDVPTWGDQVAKPGSDSGGAMHASPCDIPKQTRG